MLLPILILCLSHLVLASSVQPEYNMHDMEQLTYHFNDFMVKHNKSYTDEEETLRFHYFKENLAKINELNRRNPLAVFGINKFADWSAEELHIFAGARGASLHDDYGSCSVGVASDIKTGSVSESLDWRDKNAVTPIQDQQQCGSCWAFSAASVLEGAYALKHNTLLKLSEQQFVDCDIKSFACKGGFIEQAITLNMQQGGQELEQDYPYKAVQQKCQFDVNKAKVKATACKVFLDIGDKEKLENLLATVGPLAITLDASDIFQFYVSGIIADDNCATDEDPLVHAVSLIGYGNEGDVPYWIIKNSYGSDWGESGYVRLQRGVGCLMIGEYALTADVE